MKSQMSSDARKDCVIIYKTDKKIIPIFYPKVFWDQTIT